MREQTAWTEPDRDWLKRTFRAHMGEPDYMLCIPGHMVPIITGKLVELLEREAWGTRYDWENGAATIKDILATMACATDITTRLDRLIAALGYTAGLPAGDPAYDAADTQRAAIERVRSGMSASGTITLDEIKAYIDQIEIYLYGIANLIGENTLPPVDPEV